MALKRHYRLYKVLEYINESSTGVTYTDIIRYAIQVGGSIYHHSKHRGYFSNQFVNEGIDNYGYPKKVGLIASFTTKTKTGYILNDKGKEKLKELNLKFKEG